MATTQRMHSSASMTSVLIVLLITLCLGCTPKIVPPHSASGLEIVPDAWAFGDTSALRLRQEFCLTNRTGRDLRLEARSSCGCARALSMPTTLPKGASGTLLLEIDMARETGDIRKHFFLVDPSTDLPPFEIPITGTVKEGFRLRCVPDFVDMGAVSVGSIAQAVVHIVTDETLEDPCVEIIGSQEGVRATWEPLYDAAHGGQLTVSFEPLTYPGTVCAQVIVRRGDTSGTESGVTFVGRAYGPVDVSPEVVTLGSIESGASIDTNLLLTVAAPGHMPETFECIGLPGSVTVQATRLTPNQTQLHLTGHVPKDTNPVLAGHIKAVAGNKIEQAVSIPVLGLIYHEALTESSEDLNQTASAGIRPVQKEEVL